MPCLYPARHANSTTLKKRLIYISDFAGISVPSLKICFLVAQYIPYSGKKQEEISYSAKTQAGGEKPPA